MPDERTITQLMEMGFGREHVVTALRATETSRVEVAMEYLLTHPEPSPSSSGECDTGRFFASAFSGAGTGFCLVCFFFSLRL